MNEWDYQLRISFEENYAKKIRHYESNKENDKLLELLEKFNAKLVCQYDAFLEYVIEAEKNGVENYPLYKWTKATIENDYKKEKYLKSFTIYIDDQHVYPKNSADSLENKLIKLKEKNLNISGIFKYDTNPKNNPQVPDEYK